MGEHPICGRAAQRDCYGLGCNDDVANRPLGLVGGCASQDVNRFSLNFRCLVTSVAPGPTEDCCMNMK